jgi:hypothetical protein
MLPKDSPVPPETVFIWSHPRALSTALLRSLAELPDAVTVLEPFMVPWQVDMGVYRGCESRPPNYKEAIDNLVTGHYLSSDTSTSHKKPPIQIVKDMPCHGGMALLEQVTAAFPEAKHVLLVRHPFTTIPSYLKVSVGYSDEVMREDISYRGLLKYAEHLSHKQQQEKQPQEIEVPPPPAFLLMDADSLMGQPEQALRRLCKHIKAEYTPALLHWEANTPPKSWGNLDVFEDWLDNVLGSSGWVQKPGLPKQPAQALAKDGPPLQSEFIDENMPVYELLLSLAAKQEEQQ